MQNERRNTLDRGPGFSSTSVFESDHEKQMDTSEADRVRTHDPRIKRPPACKHLSGRVEPTRRDDISSRTQTLFWKAERSNARFIN